MYILHLLEDGTITIDGLEDKNAKIDVNEILAVMSFQIQLEDGYTLYSYFNMLKKYPLLQKLDYWLPPFVELFDKTKMSSVESLDSDNKITVGHQMSIRTKSISNRNEIRTEEPTPDGGITISIDLDNALYEEDYNVNMYISCEGHYNETIFSLAPLADVLLLPIELNNTFEFECLQRDVPEVLQHQYENDSAISLYDFIINIIYELSFHGDDESKKEVEAELSKRMNELDSIDSNTLNDIYGLVDDDDSDIDK